MIHGRFQSIPAKEVSAFRENQIANEKKCRPLYGLGAHVLGNKHPGKYRGGHKYGNAIKEAVRNLGDQR